MTSLKIDRQKRATARGAEMSTTVECERFLEETRTRLGYGKLSRHQSEAILKFITGRDVLVILPTGSGKFSRCALIGSGQPD